MKNIIVYLFLESQSERAMLGRFLDELGYTVHLSSSFTLERCLQSDIIILDEVNAQGVGHDILKEKQHLNSLFLPAVILISQHPYETTGYQLGFDAVLRAPIEKEGLALQFSLLTSLIDSKKQITYMAHHDLLTGLYNRNKLNLLLNQALLNAEKNQEQVACIYIDLDWFKSINASCGQLIGDKVLREVASRIKKIISMTDSIARVSADEFVIILTQRPVLKESLNQTIHKMRELLAIPFIIDAHTLHIKISMGISIYPMNGMDSTTLFNNAYTAMYSAKKRGGDNVAFCSQGLSKRAQDKVVLEVQLRGALSNNEFYIHFQPKFDLKSNKITGVEALLRWNNAVLGELSPKDFIPLAEEIGLITSLTEIMFTQVCEHINQWKKENRAPLNVAVNLSGKSFLDLKFMDLIANILKQQNIDPNIITIEITESVLIQEIEHNANILRAFKEMGLNISIDDFGTGYSSLSYLKYFTIDSLKIDQSFIRDLTINSSDSLIVNAIIAMAHSLKFKVIAEGVETKEQLDFLRNHGCDEVQGYYFCKPMLPQDMLQFIEQHQFAVQISNTLQK